MKKYIFSRIIKSCISIFLVVSIIIVMIFTLIPREKLFDADTGYQKLKGDNKTAYIYMRYKDVGYLDFQKVADMCNAESEDVKACLINNSEENKRVVEIYEQNGYTVDYFRSGAPFAYKDYNFLELIWNFWSNLIKVDNPNAIQDVNNPDLERNYYIGKDQKGLPAILCSGCKYKYQVYLGDGFPYIHQNVISLNFGLSYPVKAGVPTMTVISQGQGAQKKVEQTFPTGVTMESAINQHTLTYKEELDHLDQNKFTDHYANSDYYYESPSMIQTSYIFGVTSLIFAYILAIPAGIAMSRNKDKWGDKFGIAFINLVIAMPSLALIFFIRQISTEFGLPDKFPLLGFTSIKSYITPIVILTLLGMPSLMTWTRRYMIDQSNSDYVKFARAKGLSQKEIFTRHILKNAIIPIVQGIPGSVILCISGALITESAFAIPGMGKMLPDSIKVMNNRMVITLTFIFAALAIFSVLIGDILMTIVDPRIQLASKKRGKH